MTGHLLEHLFSVPLFIDWLASYKDHKSIWKLQTMGLHEKQERITHQNGVWHGCINYHYLVSF